MSLSSSKKKIRKNERKKKDAGRHDAREAVEWHLGLGHALCSTSLLINTHTRKHSHNLKKKKKKNTQPESNNKNNILLESETKNKRGEGDRVHIYTHLDIVINGRRKEVHVEVCKDNCARALDKGITDV